MRSTLGTSSVLLILWLAPPVGPLSLRAQAPAVSQTYREAYSAGYEDGLRAGQQDRYEQRLYDLAGKKEFQRADRGLDLSRHDPEVYYVAYRRGFEDGYEEGYGLEQGLQKGNFPRLRSTADPTGDLAAAREGLPLAEGSQIKVRLLDTLSTQRNQKGDRFRAKVLEDVVVDELILVPKGTVLEGVVTRSRRAGRVSGRAEMNLRFELLRFADGTEIPVQAALVGIEERADETVKDDEGTLEGAGSKGEDAKSVGTTSAIGGLIGALAGGKKGAGIGAAAGAAIGLAKVLATRGRDVDIYAGTEMTIRFEEEVRIPSRLVHPNP